MEEVVCYEIQRLINEQRDLPQLLVIDGGKGQLYYIKVIETT